MSVWPLQQPFSGRLTSFFRSRGHRSLMPSPPKAPSVGMLLGVPYYGYLVSVQSLLHTCLINCEDIANRFIALLAFPETKELTLEELDAVFGVPTRKQVARGLKEPGYWIQKYIFKRDVELPPLVDIGQLRGEADAKGSMAGAV